MLKTMTVPFVDLVAQYDSIKEEVDRAISEVVSTAAFVGGKWVNEFAEAFAAELGVKHCVPVGNGTDAIYIVLRMLGVGSGDEVIVPATSWISTSEVVSQTGARPVFVDVDQCMHMDVSKVEAVVTDRTKAIIPVHLYGQAAEMDAIVEIANRHGLYIVEDCAQAHFASYKGRRVGLFGVAGTFSFYPGKNLGAYGDAGAIVTDDDELALRCRMYANHGALKKHEHQMEGINSRLDGIQAAVLLVKLARIHHWNRKRAEIADRYDRLLLDIPGVTTPVRRGSASHVFHLYVIKCDRRDELRSWLGRHNVATAIHYPTPLPLLPAYRYLRQGPCDFPSATEAHRRIVSLPMYPEMPDDHVAYVASAIREFAARSCS